MIIYEKDPLDVIEKNILGGLKFYDQEGNLLMDAEKILSTIKEKGYVDVETADGRRWEEALGKKGLLYMREPLRAKKLRKEPISPKVETKTMEELVRLGGLGGGGWLLGLGIFLYFVGFVASISIPTSIDLESIRNYHNLMKIVYAMMFFGHLLCFTGIGLLIVGFYNDWKIVSIHQLKNRPKEDK